MNVSWTHSITNLIVLVLASTMVRDASANNAQRPNVLFISVDDLNDWTGCLGGHPQAITPNIDRLAASGVLFTNAHCAAPACNPSRTAIMTGISPHKSGLYENGQKMREILPDAELLPKYFANHGWRIHRSTRPGAVWLITDLTDRSLGYFVVGDRSAQAVIPEDE